MTLPRSHRHLLVRGGTVVTMDPARRVLRGDVLVTEGRIAAVGPDLEAPPATRLLEAEGLFVFPGFIQGHGSLGRTLFRGMAAGLPPSERLGRILKLETAHTEESAYASALLGAADGLLSGVTTVLDTGLVRGTEGLLRALEDSGIRAWAGKCLLAPDELPPDLRQSTADALGEAEALARRWRGAGRGRLQPAVCLRDLAEGSGELWEGAVALAAALDAPVHTRLPEAVSTAAGKAADTAPLKFLDACGALDLPRLSLALGTRLEGAQLDLLGDRRLGLVHCAAPETGWGTGVPDLSALRARANLVVGLGSGDEATGAASSLLDAMRATVFQQRAAHGSLDPEAVLEMATVDGARALGLESDLGSLEPGKFGDLVVLDLDRPGTATAGPVGPASRVVRGAGRDAVRWVVVDGEVLVQDGVLPHLEQEALVPRFREAGEDLVARAGIA